MHTLTSTLCTPTYPPTILIMHCTTHSPTHRCMIHLVPYQVRELIYREILEYHPQRLVH